MGFMRRLGLPPSAFLLYVLCASGQTAPAEKLLKQAITLHQAGDIDGAIRSYKEYLALRPDSPMAISNLGAAYARVGRYEDAITQYRRALKQQPGNTPVELNLALAYYKSGQAEQASTILEKVHKAAPDQLQPVLLLADCWLAIGKNKSVVELLTPLAERQADDLAVAYALGTALVRDNQFMRGQVVIERILRNGDSAEARLLMGTTKLSMHDNAGALVDLSNAAELNPKLPDVYSYYGQALLNTGDPAGAAEAFRKALAANPNDFVANLQFAVVLRQDEHYDEAQKYLRRALQVRPGDLAVRYQLASIDFNQGKLDASLAALESIVKEAPNFTEAHVTLATVYYRLKRKADGDKERAIVVKLNAEAQAKEPGVNVK
jgi:tetratricopeptide (TPR) repeat protein